MRKIAVNEFGSLSIAEGKVICPFGRTDDEDYPCKTTCAWFSTVYISGVKVTIAQCKGIDIGEMQ